MRVADLLAEWFETFALDVRREVEGLGKGELDRLPAPRSNSIGVTIWHCARWMDVLDTQVLRERPAEEEEWHSGGWATRTGYDPRGIGTLGLGAITGYSWEQVEQIPTLPPDALLAYLDAVAGSLVPRLRAMPEDAFLRPAAVPGSDRTVYEWLRSILKGCLGHLGEIRSMKALYLRSGSPNPDAGIG